MRRRVVFVLALAVLAAGIVFVRYSAALRERATETPAPHDAAAPRDVVEDTHADTRASESAFASELDDARERSARASTAPALEVVTYDGPTVTVVRQGSRAPVAGARVSWAPRTTGSLTADGRPWFEDEAAVEHAITDANGRVRLPHRAGYARVHATAPDLAGDTQVSTEDPQLEAELVVDDREHVWARVVDVDGAPVAGVPVKCVIRPIRSDPYAASVTTGADGLVELTCSLRERAQADTAWLEPELFVREPVRVALERLGTRDDPTIVRLPPLGRVRLTVFDAQGARLGDDVRIGAGLADVTARRSVAVRGGMCRLSFVEVGARVCFTGTFGVLPWTVETCGAGPAAAGDEALIEIHVADLPQVAFRFVDVDDTLVRNSTVAITLVNGTLRRVARVATDANGRLMFPLSDAWTPGTRRFASLELSSRGQAVVDLAREFPPGVTDLGDVRVGDGPLVAEGRVVDDRGTALDGARVQLVREVTDDGAVGEARWQAGALPVTTSARDGTFRLVGPTSTDTYALRVTFAGYTAVRQPIVPGQRGVVVALPECGTIRGNLVFEEGLTPENVRLELARENAPPRSVKIESKGFFRAVDLAPGRWELRATYNATSELLARVTDIVVEPAGRVELEPIELKRAAEKR